LNSTTCVNVRVTVSPRVLLCAKDGATLLLCDVLLERASMTCFHDVLHIPPQRLVRMQ
jgi:hypothetical protein